MTWKWKWADRAVWRVEVLSDAASLEETLKRTRAAWHVRQAVAPPAERGPDQSQQEFEEIAQSIEADIAVARRYAEPEAGIRVAIAAWWTGSSVENAWRAAKRAAQNLLLIETPELIRAQLADMTWQVKTTFAHDDLRQTKFLNYLKDATTHEPDREKVNNNRFELRAPPSAGAGGLSPTHRDACCSGAKQQSV